LQWLYTYVTSSCSQCFICFPDVCCKCVYFAVADVFTNIMQVFIWMLHMFTMIFKCFCKCFGCMIQIFVLLQLLHLGVSKLDRVLHLPPRLSAVSPCLRAGATGETWTGRHETRDGTSTRGSRRGPSVRALVTPHAYGIQ